MRPISIRAALLTGATLSLPAEAVLSVRPAAPPLCRVTASYTPVSWPVRARPEQRFRRIHVKLRPGCPPNGSAHVHLVNTSGRRLPEAGHYTLTPDAPRLSIPRNARYAVTTPGWTVYWRAASGRLYPVFQKLNLAPQGGDAR